MKQDVMSCSAKAPMCPCYKALAEKKGAESFESPILYDEDGDEVDFDDDDYENSGWEKTYEAESFEPHRDSKGRFSEKPLLTGSVVGGLALGLIYLIRGK